MTRMRFLSFVTLLVTAPTLFAQDWEFIRALERAQQQRPSTLTSTARIAPESEPGVPLVIRGRVFAEDRRTPLPGAIVFAYHTDKNGLYDRRETGPHSWRLKGWTKADAEGRFEFRTIRPGSYPGTTNPQHVHFSVFTAAGDRYHAGELQFEDDKLVPARERDASAREGEFGSVRPVRRDAGADHVDISLRIDSSRRF